MQFIAVRVHPVVCLRIVVFIILRRRPSAEGLADFDLRGLEWHVPQDELQDTVAAGAVRKVLESVLGELHALEDLL